MDVLSSKKDFNKNSKALSSTSTPERIESLYDSLHTYIHAATADNTRRAYRQDIMHFIGWGGMLPTTSNELIRYLEHYAKSLNPRTLVRRLTAIKHWHVYQGFLDPTTHPFVRKTLKGIQNIHGKPRIKAPALEFSHLIAMVNLIKNSQKAIDIRNNALIQIGFFGAFRRSELATIHSNQIHFVNEGVEILLPRSKTDQTGEGIVCAIPYGNQTLCAVSALKNWLRLLPTGEGYLFKRITKSGTLSALPIAPSQINLIIKKLAQDCHLPDAHRYSGHSLRRGFATTASQQGISLSAIMQQGRWQDSTTALGYMEEANRFKANAAGMLLKTLK